MRLGFLKASDLVKLFDDYGDGLFYENVRDWLGPMSGKKAPDQLTVNQEIAQTIAKTPERFLERNNGITFKARRVVPKDGTIELQEASVVNGCQTTMALVKAASSVEACLVQVKVVESDDAWDVAKAANYQNPVAKINLELAPYIRPQLVRQAAAEAGVKIDDAGADNAVSLLNSLYNDRLQYEELRFLYIGLLSISPNNIIDQIYTSLRDDLLTGFAQTEADRGLMMDCMFQLTLQTREIITEAKDLFSSQEAFGPFMRIFEQEKPQYRMFLSIVAISALVGIDVSERLPPGKELGRMRCFLTKVRALLQSDPNSFRTAYLKAVSALATGARDGPDDDAKVRQRLSVYVGRAFRQLYLSLTAQLAVDRAIDSGNHPRPTAISEKSRFIGGSEPVRVPDDPGQAAQADWESTERPQNDSLRLRYLSGVDFRFGVLLAPKRSVRVRLEQLAASTNPLPSHSHPPEIPPAPD